MVKKGEKLMGWVEMDVNKTAVEVMGVLMS